MLYTVVASRVHVFTYFSLLNETDYQVFCVHMLVIMGVNISKSKQKWKKGRKKRANHPFSILRTLCESV